MAEKPKPLSHFILNLLQTHPFPTFDQTTHSNPLKTCTHQIKAPSAIDVDFFIGGQAQAMINKLNRKRELHGYDPNWVMYSDIVDKEGNQYVDLVQEGGGVLGIALLGYTYVLEEFGIRFLSMGGTSAGAINTVLLAAAGKPHEKRTVKLIELLIGKDFFDFVDTDDKHLKSFFKNVFGSKVKKLKLIWDFLFCIDNIINLKDIHGLNPGYEFEQWLQQELQHFNVQRTSELVERMKPRPGTLMHRMESDLLNPVANPIEPKLAIIATDITTQTKVEFPKMADLYWAKPYEENPASFVRASMSIPVFFEPFYKTDLPNGKEATCRWQEKAMYDGDVPERVLFVDGGVVSNFPFDLFHEKGCIPRKPTFGIKLGVGRHKIFKTKKLVHLLDHIFLAARQMNDFDFVQKNKEEYVHPVKSIDTDGFSWLDYNILSSPTIIR